MIFPFDISVSIAGRSVVFLVSSDNITGHGDTLEAAAANWRNKWGWRYIETQSNPD